MGAVGGPKTGGRKKGTPNKRTTERKAAMRAAVEQIGELIPEAFAGDAHAFLMAVDKKPKLDLRVVVDAAGKAPAYEKPRLASVEMTQRSLDDLSPTEFRREACYADRAWRRCGGRCVRRSARENRASRPPVWTGRKERPGALISSL